MRKSTGIALPKGKLGVLTVGMGAVATTFMAGVDLVRRKKSLPIGSLTQLGTIRLGKRTEGRAPAIKDFVPLATLEDIVFGGWDIFPDSAYEAAKNAAVLSTEHLAEVKKFLSKIRPMKAAFDQNYVKKLTGTHVKKGRNKYELRCKSATTFRNSRRKTKFRGPS
jgi:myo-inositol-1-phosphate synthase